MQDTQQLALLCTSPEKGQTAITDGFVPNGNALWEGLSPPLSSTLCSAVQSVEALEAQRGLGMGSMLQRGE